MTARFELAQLNIGRARGPIDGSVMAGFVANLARINALADASPGFVWRLQGETGDATSIHPFDDPRVIVNLSVWTSVDALSDYVYRSDHVAVLRQRKDWFVPMDGPHLVLWWVAQGHRPSPEEARRRLEALAARGPHPDAFTIKQPFPAPTDG